MVFTPFMNFCILSICHFKELFFQAITPCTVGLAYQILLASISKLSSLHKNDVSKNDIQEAYNKQAGYCQRVHLSKFG